MQTQTTDIKHGDHIILTMTDDMKIVLDTNSMSQKIKDIETKRTAGRIIAIEKAKKSKKPVVIVPTGMTGKGLKRSTKRIEIKKDLYIIEAPVLKPEKEQLIRTTNTSRIGLAKCLLARNASEKEIYDVFLEMYKETKGVTGKAFIEKRIKKYMNIARKEVI